MNWIERGSIEGTENLHNMDRPRGLAAMVLLVELMMVFWFSAALISIPASGSGGHSTVHVVSIAPALVWAVSALKDDTSEVFFPEEQDIVDENDGAGDSIAPSLETAGDGAEVGGTAAPDDIRIVSISPSPAIALWAGDVVNFDVEVEYNLASANDGSLALIIEECGDEISPLPDTVSKAVRDPSLLGTRDDAVVERGRKTQKFQKRIRVPVACRVDVSVHLLPNQAASGPADSRHYHIIDPGKAAIGSQSTAKILSIQPAAGSPLRPGDNVAFEVVAEYNLTAESGVLHLTVDDGGSTPIAAFSENVRKGQRRIVFRERVRIPDATTSGSIAVTLWLGESEPRQTVSYRLAGRP